MDLVLLGLIIAFVVWYLISVSRTRPSPEAIDLGSVRAAMISRHGWDTERTNAAEKEYLRFLTLVQMQPTFLVIPWLDKDGRDDLDQFWHQHILDTAKYAADCKLLFGKIIHHNPHIQRGSDLEKNAAQKTLALYTRKFQSGTFGSDADLELLVADSGSDFSTDAHSGHGHGAHGHSCGGHGGDGGGHGCGGHGCGGHGCGGGH